MIDKITSKRIHAYTESKLHPRAASSSAKQPILIFQQHKNTLKKITRQSSKFSHSVVSDSLQPHGLQHSRPPCQSPIPKVYSTHVHWVSDAIQTSHPVMPFSSWPQSLPASGSFQMSQLFTSGGQSIGVSASAPVLPMNAQDWYPLGWTCQIFLQYKGLSRDFSNTTVHKNQFFDAPLSL